MTLGSDHSIRINTVIANVRAVREIFGGAELSVL
jgi:hypothetical protein